jgi:hypothetical protein
MIKNTRMEVNVWAECPNCHKPFVFITYNGYHAPHQLIQQYEKWQHEVKIIECIKCHKNFCLV